MQMKVEMERTNRGVLRDYEETQRKMTAQIEDL